MAPQSLENRTRLPLEIIAGLRERLGADYPLGLRIERVRSGVPTRG